ncbi:MAG: RNA polymerase sigma factor RpoD/SigA [bacterium]
MNQGIGFQEMGPVASSFAFKKKRGRVKRELLDSPRPRKIRRPKKTENVQDRGVWDTMAVYVNSLSTDRITLEQEGELARAIATGDREAWRKLVKGNLRLVVKIAHDFKGLGLPLIDLTSEGNIGLMRAAEKFDPTKGAKFSSYASWWIKQAMRRALANQARTVRVPIQSASKISKVRTARIKLGDTLGREATDAEIATEVDMTKRVVNGLSRINLSSIVSLDETIGERDEDTRHELVGDDSAQNPFDDADRMGCVEMIKEMIHTLDEREQLVVRMRFGLDGDQPKTLGEISLLVGRSRERVRQIQEEAQGKLRQLLIKKGCEW